MPDISQHLPKDSRTVTAIYAAYKKAGDTGHMSQTIGAGSIGHDCERYLWYCFRQCCKPEFEGRMYRLFETGNLEEPRFIKDLRTIGCTVHDVDPNRSGERTQQYKITALGGHVKGYLDSVIYGLPEAPKTWHVGEFKTHNAKSFKKLIKEGVEKSKPLHFCQMQIGMHLTGMKRALYLARNKDTDELYSERVKYHEECAKALVERAGRIITATSPPGRCANRRDHFRCKWCDANKICWGSTESGPALPVPVLSCRQCCHATPIIEGENARWKCENGRVIISTDGGCNNHLTLPGLLETFAEPVDSGSDFITFENKDGSKWQHGDGDGCFSSKELMELAPSHLCNKTIQKVKDVFGAVVVDCVDDILLRYPESDSRSVWKGPQEDIARAWVEIYGEDLLEIPSIKECNLPEYSALEFEGGRVAIIWREEGGLLHCKAEIRQGLE